MVLLKNVVFVSLWNQMKTKPKWCSSDITAIYGTFIFKSKILIFERKITSCKQFG